MPHHNPRDQQTAIDWARRMLDTKSAVILDFETTGFKGSEIVQIGMIDVRGNTLMQTYVRPNGRIPREATKVHGITDDMVKDAPTFNALYVGLSSHLAGQTVIAYNADFEQGILEGICQRRKLPAPRVAAWSCAMKTYAKYYGQWNARYRSYRWQSLSNACTQQRIVVQDAHDAIGDCRMTLELLRIMAG